MATYWAGYQVKLNVNGVAYAAARLSIHATAADLDVTNTEGFAGNPLVVAQTVGVAARIPGISEVEFRVTNATFDSVGNPFAAPFSITVGAYLALRVFKNTRAGVSWVAASALVVEASDEIDVKGLQPTTFVARSDGLFLLPAV